MFTNTMAKEAALRGADLLDEKVPGWRDKAKPGELQMAEPCGCILWQVFGDYSEGLAAIGNPEEDFYGFDVYIDAPYGYEDLNNAWRELLSA